MPYIPPAAFSKSDGEASKLECGVGTSSLLIPALASVEHGTEILLSELFASGIISVTSACCSWQPDNCASLLPAVLTLDCVNAFSTSVTIFIQLHYIHTNTGYSNRIFTENNLNSHIYTYTLYVRMYVVTNSTYFAASLYDLGLGDSTIVIHCRDSWLIIVMMIGLFDYHDSSRHDI